LSVDRIEVGEHEDVEAAITLTAYGEVDAATITLDSSELTPTQPQHRFTTTLAEGETRRIVVPLEAARWGRHPLGPVTAIVRGPALLTASPVQPTTRRLIAVLPAAENFEATAAIPHALAYAGEHRAVYRGPGVDFSAVRPFSHGDPLRRINWPATLKLGELHVTATFTERSSEVIVALDSSYDAGPPDGTVLDLSVRAAASICAHYLQRGDVVRVVEFGGQRRWFTNFATRQQLQHIRRWLTDVHSPIGELEHRDELRLVVTDAPRSLVIVLTPLLDDAVAGQLALVRQRGSAVVAVDTLPDAARPRALDQGERVALRLWSMQREMLVSRLGELGVPVVPWAGTGSLDNVLRDVVRMAGAPRVVNR